MSTEKEIVVIGGGLAGLSAVVTAAKINKDLKITLIEKESRLGGNSAKATSGINAVGSPAQKREKVEDSFELFIQDTQKSGKGNSCKGLCETLVKGSTSAISFLESFNVDVSTLSQLGGHSAKRTHRANPSKVRMNIGGHIVKQLIDSLPNFPNVTVKSSCRVTELKRLDNKKIEITCENEKKESESHAYDIVILTSGGFGADTSEGGLLTQYKPEFQVLPTTNGGFSTGDGIKLMKDLNAALVDMCEIQVHPTGFISEKTANDGKVFLAPEALRGCGGILMKSPGKRFVNELGTRDFVTDHIWKNCPDMFNNKRKVAHLLLGEEAAEKFGVGTLGFYQKFGLVKKYDNGKALCEGEGFDYEVFKKEIEDYNEAMKTGKDVHGKVVFPVAYDIEKTFYRLFTTPSIHYSMGGLKINKNAEVMNKEGKVIEGIFGAGEVTGGVHGKNRLGGNSLLECVVFGRIAGENAVKKLE